MHGSRERKFVFGIERRESDDESSLVILYVSSKRIWHGWFTLWDGVCVWCDVGYGG